MNEMSAFNCIRLQSKRITFAITLHWTRHHKWIVFSLFLTLSFSLARFATLSNSILRWHVQLGSTGSTHTHTHKQVCSNTRKALRNVYECDAKAEWQKTNAQGSVKSREWKRRETRLGEGLREREVYLKVHKSKLELCIISIFTVSVIFWYFL